MNFNFDIRSQMQKACGKIAPLWSLEHFVAVNPYYGLSDMTFEEAAMLLSRTGGGKMTMPVSFYLNAIDEGIMTREDLKRALSTVDSFEDPDVDTFLDQIRLEANADNQSRRVSIAADVASELTGTDWSSLMLERVTSWAAPYFDKGQALWRTSPLEQDMFTSWKIEASTDATPLVMGLKGFREAVKGLPDDPFDAAAESIESLGIATEVLELYLHTLLQRTGGWSAYAAGLDWNERLYGGKPDKLLTFLSILLSWERCLIQSLADKGLSNAWDHEVKSWQQLQRQGMDRQLHVRLILQQAFDNANQRELVEKINVASDDSLIDNGNPLAQAVFCIDVRSEIFRRNLEHVSSQVRTIGTAGFFGFPLKYIPIGHESGEDQCPALIPSKHNVLEMIPEKEAYIKAVRKRKTSHQLEKAWKSFKHGAVSCFSFMGPVGLSYLPKIYSDTFGLTRPVPHPAVAGIGKRMFKNIDVGLDAANHEGLSVGIPIEEQIEMAASALRAMSLTGNFSRIVLIVGHGSTSVNNPHATGLDCGACGGHSGEPNARVAVRVLNTPDVRKGLEQRDIFIPQDTLFVAALHDTTTDEVTLFGQNPLSESHQKDIAQLKEWLALAGEASRKERAARLPGSGGKKVDSEIFLRSKDWSQVRPEWGLAGCSTFVVAPRKRTEKINFVGKSFLHDYDWKSDERFGVLELIMTAPMIVTSWINLQYYASVVDNRNYGAGNKTLHNITGGIGVLEGYSGDLRAGLPWQSVHDGLELQHLPHRLNVVIEAPIEAMDAIIKKHPLVRNLCDNHWIKLFAMDGKGQVAFEYLGYFQWNPIYKSVEEYLDQAPVPIETSDGEAA